MFSVVILHLLSHLCYNSHIFEICLWNYGWKEHLTYGMNIAHDDYIRIYKS